MLPSGLLGLGLLVDARGEVPADVLEGRLESFHAFLLKRGTIPDTEQVINYPPPGKRWRGLCPGKVCRTETDAGSTEVNESRRLTLSTTRTESSIGLFRQPTPIQARMRIVPPSELTLIPVSTLVLRQSSPSTRNTRRPLSGGRWPILRERAWSPQIPMAMDGDQRGSTLGLRQSPPTSRKPAAGADGLKEMEGRTGTVKSIAKDIQRLGRKRLGQPYLSRAESTSSTSRMP